MSSPYCFGNDPESMRLLDAMKRFVQLHRANPHFVFSFLWKLSHDKVNEVGNVNFILGVLGVA